MKIIKRELFVCFAVTAFVILCALAWGSPFVGTSTGSNSSPMQMQQNQAMIFRGVVSGQGGQYLLRDSSGESFQLDNAQRAQSFAGHTVMVTGHLDAASRTIHVDSIQPAA